MELPSDLRFYSRDEQPIINLSSNVNLGLFSKRDRITSDNAMSHKCTGKHSEIKGILGICICIIIII